MKICALIAVLVFVSLPACVSLAEDWPGWRGLRGDGTSSETIVPLHWSATENLIWKRPIPGTGRSSPIVKGRHVFVTTGDAADESRRVLCLDRESGDLLWNVSVHRGSGGEDQMILTGSSETVALVPRTGKTLWFAQGPSEKFVSTPAVGHGLVFSFGGSPSKRAMSIRLGGSGDMANTHIAWRNERSMPYVPSPLLAGDYLHVISDDGIYTCLDPKTGEVRHTGRKLGAVSSSPVAAAGRVYFFEDSGRCTVIENGAAFDVIATNEIGETVCTTPAISAGSIFVRTEECLVRIGAPAN